MLKGNGAGAFSAYNPSTGSYAHGSAAWGPDGREAFVFQGATLRVVDARTGKRHRQQSLPNLYTFTSAALLADGVTALIGVRYYDRSMYDGWSECWLWDTESGAARWRARADAACLMLSPDERWFAHETYTSVTFRSVRDGRELDAILREGRGVRNMRARAALLGGVIAWQGAAPRGCRVTLRTPLSGLGPGPGAEEAT